LEPGRKASSSFSVSPMPSTEKLNSSLPGKTEMLTGLSSNITKQGKEGWIWSKEIN